MVRATAEDNTRIVRSKNAVGLVGWELLEHGEMCR